jgi:hypothetical protein
MTNIAANAAESDRGYKMGTELAADMKVHELVAYIETLGDTDLFAGHYWSGMRFGLGDALVARPAYYASK